MQVTESKGVAKTGLLGFQNFFWCFLILERNEKQMRRKKRRRKRKPHKQQPSGTLRAAGKTDSRESKGGLNADSLAFSIFLLFSVLCRGFNPACLIVL